MSVKPSLGVPTEQFRIRLQALRPGFCALYRSVAALYQLHAFCAEQMHEMGVPAGFVALAEIPRSPEGKVLRARLRELVRAR